MVDARTLVRGLFGTCISAAAIKVDDLQSIESITGIVCTSLGLLITLVSAVIIPLIKWYRESKKDGKIDAEEVEKLAETIQKGAEEVKKTLDEAKNDPKDSDE